MNNLLFLLQIKSVSCYFAQFLHVNKYSYELSMKTTPVLLNGKYGGFSFSKIFKTEFEKEYNISVPFYKSYFPHDFKNSIESRYDERILNIYKQLGIESCGKYCGIFTEEVPDDLLPYIDISEYDGKETLTVNMSKKYKDLLLEAIDNPDKRVSNDDFLEILNMKMYEKYLDDNFIEYS